MPFRTTLLFASLIAPLACGFASPAASAPSPYPTCSAKPASPLVVSVKSKGAKGDGHTDDTRSIQLAVDEVAGTGGTVYVPNGVYLLRTSGVQLKSNMTLKLADRAVLKMLPNGAPVYAVVKVANASDVTVVGGTLEGERAQHKGKQGEWGFGLHIGPRAARVTVVGVTAKDMWGDGFYVGGATDVAFCSVAADHNRRQGLSITDADRLLVTNSVFRNTHGTRPSAGLDIEPNKPKERVTNVRIENSKFIDNAGGDIIIAGKKGDVMHVEIMRNVFRSVRPILVENAPAIRSTAICKNRHISKQTPPSEGFNNFTEPVEVVAFQSDCNQGSDMRFEVNRITTKKRKK